MHTSAARCASGIRAIRSTPSLSASLATALATSGGKRPTSQLRTMPLPVSLIDPLLLHDHFEHDVRHPLADDAARDLAAEPWRSALERAACFDHGAAALPEHHHDREPRGVRGGPDLRHPSSE